MEMNEVRQQLMQLESADIVQRWFSLLHNKRITLKKTKEINSAAKQSSEFFRNAEISNYSVRPLLSYYGINTLSKALILLFNPEKGENHIKPGHGLNTLNWGSVLLQEEMKDSLMGLGKLQIQTCSGLFRELLIATNNATSIHAYSSVVDWRLNYDIPQNHQCISFNELISRIPDLNRDLKNLDINVRYCIVDNFTYCNEEGFNCNVKSEFELMSTIYKDVGYNIKINDVGYLLNCNTESFKRNPPFFLHSYTNKSFGTIPILYIVQPFDNHSCYSEISLIYMLSFYLGMLVRYYPTQWNALTQGENGDIYWPLLNRAMHYTETVFPELVIEFINDRLELAKVN